MSERPIRVWRLRVLYPLGAFEPGWQPEGWEGESCFCTYSDDCRCDEFNWPRVRNYLTEKSAVARANLLRSYGAEVFVEPSDPVEWS